LKKTVHSSVCSVLCHQGLTIESLSWLLALPSMQTNLIWLAVIRAQQEYSDQSNTTIISLCFTNKSLWSMQGCPNVLSCMLVKQPQAK